MKTVISLIVSVGSTDEVVTPPGIRTEQKCQLSESVPRFGKGCIATLLLRPRPLGGLLSSLRLSDHHELVPKTAGRPGLKRESRYERNPCARDRGEEWKKSSLVFERLVKSRFTQIWQRSLNK